MKHWYVVYTKAGQERLAEGNLQAQGFETYMPRLASRRKGAPRGAVTTVPMFSRYIFVRIDVDAAPWRSINGTYGVSSLVSFGDRPARVPDTVIDELRSREDETGVVHLPKVAPFQPGESLEISDGPLSEVRCLYQARTSQERGIVLMSLLGREVPVRVQQEKLRRAS
ncbi:MAG: transcriptional activator RfaH [Alphaproteobacteria bacterium]|nr:transcriptional activator RfaH [Alphaproteobacteria bacterium]